MRMKSKYATRRGHPRVRPVVICGLAIMFLCFAATISRAQLPPAPEHGFQPAGSYALSNIESINTANGNMIMTVPLAALPVGRGGSPGFQVNLTYNSKLYETYIEQLPDPVTQEPTNYIFLNASEQGGWHYNVSPYALQLISRTDLEGTYPCPAGCNSVDLQKNAYIWKLKIIFPDGGEHEVRPVGYLDYFADGYYNIDPNGVVSATSCSTVGGGSASCAYGTYQGTTSGLSYYTTDGTFMRLDIPYTPNGGWSNNWTLSFPDGRRVVSTNGVQRTYDRNNNYTEIQSLTYNNHFAQRVVDQLGRSIIIEYDSAAARDYIYLWGANGEQSKWTVKWKTIYAYKPYRATASGIHRSNFYPTTGSNYALVIDQIILPVQAGSLAYTFGYNAPDIDPYPSYSYGWGEISSITLPSAAQATYAWTYDGPGAAQPPLVSWVLQEAVTRKDLHYNAEYDGAATPITDTWTYSAPMNYGTVMTITGPDGGVTRNYSDSSGPFSRVSYKTENPDGSVIERLWLQNIPYLNPPTNSGVNPYVKTEFRSIKDAAGNLSLTAIKDYNYDKNGNVTQVKEYDWVAYASAHPGGGGPVIPAGAQPQRITGTTFFNPTPDASDSSYNPNVYHQVTSAQSRNIVAASEVRDNTQTFSRTEFFYDNPSTTANLTQQKSWDSTSGAYSNPLTTGNSISVSSQYTTWSSGATGKLMQTTDARGFQTVLTYGSVGGFDLYPTQIQTAYGTSVQRTETRAYDFSTGLVTSSTDADNNVTTATTYDVFGRPTLVRAAAGKPEETRTATEYSDVNRRVIVRSDLNTAGDGKLVNIQHYDQLGRVRLQRQLEDSGTQAATDETAGIKVQTRYAFSGVNSYVLVSNPYRSAYSYQAAEPTMGWSRTKSNNGGQVVEVQTLAGPTLPAPWGANTTSTGTVTTAYDANYTTVTDQNGKVRRSKIDALDQLVRVDEPNGSGSLGANESPVQPTSYAYTPLGNLKEVNQDTQTRTFVYSSLGRLLSATNPESGTITYLYDNNGNLTRKTDARGIYIDYVYDALNRNTTVDYSDTTTINPDISRFYDGAVNGKGRFWYFYAGGNYSTGSNVEHQAIDSYDALGRPLTQRQIFKWNNVWGPTYPLQQSYDLAGHVKTVTYPSGYPSRRTVNYKYDASGRLNDFEGTAAMTGTLGDGVTRTYAAALSYDAASRMREEKYGTATPLYHKMHYNVRGQLYDIRLSTVPWQTDEWNWNRGAVLNYYDSGFVPRNPNSGPDNNGNLLRSESWVPADEQISSYNWTRQNYAYDALNRLSSVTELQNGSTTSFMQAYNYDRWGNRTISNSTWGYQINAMQAVVDAGTNRMYAPNDPSHTLIDYDAAGNQTKDYLSWNGTRTYDAENRMITASNGVTDKYTYDADGKRTRRTVGKVETWYVYGLSGELVAEYAPNAPATTPDKEYGYRNGQLLVTAAPVDVALGKTATQSSTFVSGGTTFSASLAIDGNTNGTFWDVSSATTNYGYQNWWQVDLGSSQSLSSIQVWPRTDCCPEHTANFYVLVSDNAFTSTDLTTTLNQPGVSSYWVAGNDATAATVSVNRSARYVRVQRNDSQYLVLAEVKVWQATADVEWLVTDHLGTPRMIADASGSLAGIKRHDYLPFGEELFANQGGRTTSQGYGVNDGIRQKFTLKERDIETGLDYFLARYYSSTQGRFTSPDEFTGGPDELYEAAAAGNPTFYADLADPQSLNKYQYAYNNPLRFIDPDGHQGKEHVNEALKTAAQIGKDTVVGGAKELANVVIDTSNAINSLVDLVSPIKFGQVERFQPSTSGERSAMIGVDIALVAEGALSAHRTGAAIVNSRRVATMTEEMKAAGSGTSPKVGEIIKTIKKEGIQVEVNPKSVGQEGNVTISAGGNTRANIRVETHPLKPNGPPVRHANVEVIRTVRGKNRKVSYPHITQ